MNKVPTGKYEKEVGEKNVNLKTNCTGKWLYF